MHRANIEASQHLCVISNQIFLADIRVRDHMGDLIAVIFPNGPPEVVHEVTEFRLNPNSVHH